MQDPDEVSKLELEKVQVELSSGQRVEISRILISGQSNPVMLVAHELWRQFLPSMHWSPLQRKLRTLDQTRTATLMELNLLKSGNVISNNVSSITLITPEAAHAMLKGRDGFEIVAEQLAYVSTTSQRYAHPYPVRLI